MTLGYMGIVQGIQIGAVGDISCGSDGRNTIDNIDSHNPQLVLFLGDLSYEDNQDCFFNYTEDLEKNSKVVVAIGNHDLKSFDELSKHYGIPAKGYYTFEFKGNDDVPGLILVMNSERNFKMGSAQYEFIKNELENSSNYGYKIVISHKNFISCDCDHEPDINFKTYHPIFKKYGVDLVLSGHNHNYQRFEPIDNVTYIVNGLGGRDPYPLNDADQYDKKFKYGNNFTDTFGYLDLNLTKGKIFGNFIANHDTNAKDSFVVPT